MASADEAMRIDIRILGEVAYRAVVAHNRESLGPAPVGPDVEMESRNHNGICAEVPKGIHGE